MLVIGLAMVLSGRLGMRVVIAEACMVVAGGGRIAGQLRRAEVLIGYKNNAPCHLQCTDDIDFVNFISRSLINQMLTVYES